MTTPPPPDDGPRTIAGAVARGGALAVRDMLLNAGVLFSLIVGVGGAVSGTQPWVWLGPVIGVVGVLACYCESDSVQKRPTQSRLDSGSIFLTL